MMIRKLIAAGALAAAAVVAVAPAAQAGGSDYAGCLVEVDPSEFDPGETVTVTGINLQPNFETTIEFHSVVVVVGTVMTDATGAFETEVTIPTDATSGPHTITALCDAQGNVGETDVTVGGGVVTPTDDGGDGGNLPRTGSDSTEPLVVVGGVAILAGAAFVLIAKRRRSQAS